MVREIDEIAGARNRSAFIEEAVRRRLLNERQKRALQSFKGLQGEYPNWATPELTSKWVHDMRQADQDYIDARRAGRRGERERESRERAAGE